MIRLAVLFADGTEELEAITPTDILRRCDGVAVDTVSVCGEYITTSHGVKIKPDKTVVETDLCGYDGLIIPGGMPGAANIAECAAVASAIKFAEKKGKLVAAICASPAVVIAGGGFFKGKRITCYPSPSFVALLKDYDYTAADVEADGNLITANGPRAAFAFANEICEYFNLTPKF